MHAKERKEFVASETDFDSNGKASGPASDFFALHRVLCTFALKNLSQKSLRLKTEIT